MDLKKARAMNGGQGAPEQRRRLAPPEAFGDDEATEEDFWYLVPNADPARRREKSKTVARRLCCSCAGWRNPPGAEEFHAAVHAATRNSRQVSILYVWATEATWYEVLHAWAERAYTLRALARALHEAEITACRITDLLNTWVKHPERVESCCSAKKRDERRGGER